MKDSTKLKTMYKLTDKVAVVTGGSSGIGRNHEDPKPVQWFMQFKNA